MILTDELGLVVIPFLLGLYWNKVKPDFSNSNIIFSLPVFLLFLIFLTFGVVILFHQASNHQITDIVNSLRAEGVPPLKGGGIDALGWTTKANLNGTIHSIIYGRYYIYYPVLMIMCSLAFIPLKNQLKAIFKSRPILLGLLMSCALLIPVYIIANDWGRWTYILIVEIFMATLANDEEVFFNKDLFLSIKWKKMSVGSFALLGIALVTYSFFWYLPHMLPDDSSWRSFVHNVPFIRG